MFATKTFVILSNLETTDLTTTWKSTDAYDVSVTAEVYEPMKIMLKHILEKCTPVNMKTVTAGLLKDHRLPITCKSTWVNT